MKMGTDINSSRANSFVKVAPLMLTSSTKCKWVADTHYAQPNCFRIDGTLCTRAQQYYLLLDVMITSLPFSASHNHEEKTTGPEVYISSPTSAQQAWGSELTSGTTKEKKRMIYEEYNVRFGILARCIYVLCFLKLWKNWIKEIKKITSQDKAYKTQWENHFNHS